MEEKFCMNTFMIGWLAGFVSCALIQFALYMIFISTLPIPVPCPC